MNPNAARTETPAVMLSEAQQGHDDTWYWDVAECCWQAGAHAGVGYVPEYATPVPRQPSSATRGGVPTATA